MAQYIALLRGVNVGGKNKVSMPLLKAALAEAGLHDVGTYINSGNVLFSCHQQSPASLQQLCRQVVQEQFQLSIPVAVLSAADYAEALRHAPAWWDADRDAKHNALFVIAPASAVALVAEVGSNPDYERVAHHGPVIFWSAPLKTFSRTNWAKAMTSSAFGSVTIRNANTTKKLLQLIS